LFNKGLLTYLLTYQVSNTTLKTWFRRLLRHSTGKRKWTYFTAPGPHGATNF